MNLAMPGVYIQEFEPAAPIQPAGTSIAAFVGPAPSGPLRIPQKLTSFDMFKAVFGVLPLPGFYLWYAVRGFFENGGQVCYIVRASNGDYDSGVLNNRVGNKLADLRAAKLGQHVPAITVGIVSPPAVLRLPAATTQLYAPQAQYLVRNAREIQVQPGAGTGAQDAAQFRPGDIVSVGGANLTIVSIGGDVIRLDANIAAPVGANGIIRLADLAGAIWVRVISNAVPLPGDPPLTKDILTVGTILTLTQNAVSATVAVDGVQTEKLATFAPTTTYRVTLREPLAGPFSLDPAAGVAVTVEAEEIDVTVQNGAAITTYANLAQDANHPTRYFVDYLNQNNSDVVITPTDPAPNDPLPLSLPAIAAANLAIPGAAENLALLAAKDYTDALDTLKTIPDVNQIACPDAVTLADPNPAVRVQAIATVQQEIIAQCELLGNRFGVLDPEPGLNLFGSAAGRGIDTQRNGVESTRGYAALYFPFIRVEPAGAGKPILVPPSGHMCGIMARIDGDPGVFRAPAGVDCNVNGAVGVDPTMSDIDHGQLNLMGINVIRVFSDGGRPVVWGARTTASDTNWQYVNIRRLFLFLEKSLQKGLRGSVFQPNNPSLWQQLKRTITNFLLEQWEEGALYGNTAKEAFYVRIDEVLNPPSERALGRLVVEIGVQPSYPAEFIVVRIGIWDGGAKVTEV